MTDQLLLTLDLGTTNCKAVAFTRDGEPCVSASVPYPTQNPREGWYEQRVADWRAAVAAALRAVSRQLGVQAGDVAGLSLSAWGPGLVLIDVDGTALNEASPTWQDVRSLDHGHRLVQEVGPDWVGGGLPLTGFPAKLAWAIDAWPDLIARAASAIGVKDYLVHWLTGALATDPSSGPYATKWSSAVFDSIGWDTERLPPVVPSTAIAGRLRPDLAEQTGLPPDLPVVLGINDGAAATVGVGAHREGDAVVSLGTNGVFRLVSTAPVSAEVCLARSLFRYPLVEALWASGGFVLSGGSALAWFAGADAASGEVNDIDVLLHDAGKAPAGSDGVIFLPYLVGRGSPQPDPDAAAAFLGLRLRHRRSHLARAVLEGVAFGAKDIANALEALDLRTRRLFITGGGAASPLWRAILADVLGLPAGYVQGDSNLGAAIVLAVGLGLEDGFDAAVQRLVRDPETTPLTPENLSTYETAYRTFGAWAARATGIDS
jgi:xylulokinase